VLLIGTMTFLNCPRFRSQDFSHHQALVQHHGPGHLLQRLTLIVDNITLLCVVSGSEWIQFDLGLVRAVYAVVTTGRGASQDWVTSYKMMLSSDSSVWTTYTDIIGNDMVGLNSVYITSLY